VSGVKGVIDGESEDRESIRVTRLYVLDEVNQEEHEQDELD